MDGELPSSTVSPQDLWCMLLSTIRYSLGRATYMPSYCVDLYQKYKVSLSVQQRSQIAKEIKRELEIAALSDRTLGDKCDDDTWRGLLRDIEEDLCNIHPGHP